MSSDDHNHETPAPWRRSSRFLRGYHDSIRRERDGRAEDARREHEIFGRSAGRSWQLFIQADAPLGIHKAAARNILSQVLPHHTSLIVEFPLKFLGPGGLRILLDGLRNLSLGASADTWRFEEIRFVAEPAWADPESDDDDDPLWNDRYGEITSGWSVPLVVSTFCDNSSPFPYLQKFSFDAHFSDGNQAQLLKVIDNTRLATIDLGRSSCPSRVRSALLEHIVERFRSHPGSLDHLQLPELSWLTDGLPDKDTCAEARARLSEILLAGRDGILALDWSCGISGFSFRTPHITAMVQLVKDSNEWLYRLEVDALRHFSQPMQETIQDNLDRARRVQTSALSLIVLGRLLLCHSTPHDTRVETTAKKTAATFRSLPLEIQLPILESLADRRLSKRQVNNVLAYASETKTLQRWRGRGWTRAVLKSVDCWRWDGGV